MTYVEAAAAPLRKTGQIKLHGKDAFEGMRKAGRLVAECLDMLVEHANQRVTFGQKLADRQAIQWWVADAATKLHACRLMVMDAAVKQDEGRDVRMEASMIKVFATEMATEVIDHAQQAFGAMGVTQELPLSWLAQKVRTMRVYEGPSEVHRMVIARRILGGR